MGAVEDLAAKLATKHGPMLSLKQAAISAGVSRRTLARAIATGALRVSRPAGTSRVLVTARRLAEWIEGIR